MTGAEVVAKLTEMRANVPVVLITGYGEEAVREEERIGVCSVLQKPFSPDDLRGLLERHLSHRVIHAAH
jgi:DNA-binding NtrC family response regulator